ncbi:MAG TPA: hypothetical protein VGC42_11130, partial [Kofleriaceae bacterium]
DVPFARDMRAGIGGGYVTAPLGLVAGLVAPSLGYRSGSKPEATVETDESGSATTEHEVLGPMRQFRDEMCKCANRACADRVTGKLTRWGEQLAKISGHMQRPTVRQTKAMTEITEHMTSCMTKAVMAP